MAAFVYRASSGATIEFDVAHGYVIERPTGIDSLAVSYSENVGYDGMGTHITGHTLPHRIINFNGVICGPDQKAKREYLASVLSDLEGGMLEYDGFYVPVRPLNFPTFQARPISQKFSFSMISEVPWWTAIAPDVFNIEKTQPPIIGPANTYSTVALANANNDSYLDVPFSFQFTVTDISEGSSGVSLIRVNVAPPSLSVKETRRMTVKAYPGGLFKQNEVITISSDGRSLHVESNLKGNITGTLSTDTTMFGFPPHTQQVMNIRSEGGQIIGELQLRKTRSGIA